MTSLINIGGRLLVGSFFTFWGFRWMFYRAHKTRGISVALLGVSGMFLSTVVAVFGGIIPIGIGMTITVVKLIKTH